MKKVSCLILILLLSLIHVHVFAKSYDASQLPIVVRNIPEWSNEYPTVINDWKGMFVQSVTGELPPVLSVVISLNGKDTKGMNEETFHELLMSQSKSQIEYLIKQNGSNVKKECVIQYHKSIYWAEGVTMTDPTPFQENIAIKNIKNASVFNLNTYAYQTGVLTELDETSVLDAAGKALSRLGYKKIENQNNSDMILVLSKDRDDYNGHKITLNILDGKKFRIGVERILWSLDITDINGNLKTQEGAIKTALNTNCANFPFDIPTYSQSIYTLGIAFESQQAVSSGRTVEILKNSDAYDKGLRSGDAIIGAYSGVTSVIWYTITRSYYFKPNKRNRQKNWGANMILILPIIPKFAYNNAETYLSDNTPRGGLFSLNHFKVRDSYGRTFSVYAPFERRKFNLKYIK
jgi:hypothetical protein